MRKKFEFALRRQALPPNFLESLADCFGENKQSLINSQEISYRDAITFTNLVAEALIRDLDLKKGERVLLVNPNPEDFFLLSLAIIKAGGILVPIDSRLGGEEIRRRARLCMVNLALIDGDALDREPGLVDLLPDSKRLLVSGMRPIPACRPLYEAVAEGSGFFIPYTLKTTSVVGLFFREREPGGKPIMATAQMFVSGSRFLAPLLPFSEGSVVMSAAPLTSVSGFSAAFLALSAGAVLQFADHRDSRDFLAKIESRRPVMVIAPPETYADMLAAETARRDLSSVSVWVSTGPTPSETAGIFRHFGGLRMGPIELPALFLDTVSGDETSGMIAIRTWPGGGRRIGIPPNRIRIDAGERQEMLIRGPGVTPGYWNDLQESYEALRNGWFHTGVSMARS
ncbi:MAG: hypothetical protein A2W01_01320 [Candidatus Solincola sediminis]|nr:MAG: hypothetical protein A2W01_01320 [Candidatus Solincola sediminis]